MAQIGRLIQALLLVIAGSGPVSTCTDGWGKTGGVCVSLRSCTAIYQIYRSGPSSQQIRRIRNSLCRLPQGGRGVCCAIPEPPTTTTQAPLDLSQFDPNTPEGNPKRLLLPRDCGVILSERIVGGKEASLGALPWLVLLGYEGDDSYDDYYAYNYDYDTSGGSTSGDAPLKFSCGGALISDRYVVTAAHCIPKPTDKGQLKALRMGEHDLSKDEDCQISEHTNETICSDPAVDIEPERIITHREYDTPVKRKNDIALIRLKTPVNITKWVYPICLPFGKWRTGSELPNDEAKVAGFGLTKAFGDTSPTLQVLDVPIVDHGLCQNRFRQLRASIGSTQLCAGGRIGQDSCEGDSGGPLMMHETWGPPYHLIGVTSFGDTNCGVSGTPGVYTKVSDYLDWILQNIAP